MPFRFKLGTLLNVEIFSVFCVFQFMCSKWALNPNVLFGPFALLKKQAKTLFWLICCERKILFRLKKQVEKY